MIMTSINRVLAFASGKTSLTKQHKVPIVGAIFQSTSIEHLFVHYVIVDPEDITTSLINMIPTKFIHTKQIKLVFISNSILAGLGVINLNLLYEKFQSPLIVIANKQPLLDSIEKAFNHIPDGKERLDLLKKNPTNWFNIPETNLWTLSLGMSSENSTKVIQQFHEIGNYPEQLRIAILIARSLPIMC